MGPICATARSSAPISTAPRSPTCRGGGPSSSRALLQHVDFTGADLVQADFTSADLTGAVLVGATLRGARLYDANLSGADLTDAVLEGADLLRANLSGARWTDGKTICGEGSVGRCHPRGTGAKVQG